MEKGNQTTVTEFILVGFSDVLHFQFLLFVIFLCTFIISLLAHMFIILLYSVSPNLHTPMYFFLANFSILEICYLSTIVPKLLINLLSQQRTITFYGCAIQMFCSLALGSTECYLLAAMAYDRYNAISHPLLYNNIMRRVVCVRLVIGSWLIGTMVGVLQTTYIFSLPFCGSRISNYYCDIPPLLSMACNITQFNDIASSIISSILLCSFLLIIFSYTNIIWTVIKDHSTTSRKKAFSTCTSHLIVVSMFYGSGSIMYLRPKSRYGMGEEKFLSLVYTTIAPLLNPFIYTLRNNDVKCAVRKIVNEINLALVAVNDMLRPKGLFHGSITSNKNIYHR